VTDFFFTFLSHFRIDIYLEIIEMEGKESSSSPASMENVIPGAGESETSHREKMPKRQMIRTQFFFLSFAILFFQGGSLVVHQENDAGILYPKKKTLDKKEEEMHPKRWTDRFLFSLCKQKS
jgi:hypothetical protein